MEMRERELDKYSQTPAEKEFLVTYFSSNLKAEQAWLDLEIIILSEISQKEKDRHHMISLTCGI